MASESLGSDPYGKPSVSPIARNGDERVGERAVFGVEDEDSTGRSRNLQKVSEEDKVEVDDSGELETEDSIDKEVLRINEERLRKVGVDRASGA